MLKLAAGICLVTCGSRETPPAHPPPPAPPVDAAPAPAPVEATPLGRLPGDVHPRRESLVLDVDPAAERFGGTAELELDLDRPRTTIWLHGRGLHVSSVKVGQQAGTWEEVDPIGVARVTLPAPVSGRVTLTIVYDAPYDPQLVGAYRVRRGSEAAVFTKFEAIYARRAFPCFDEPRFKLPFELTLVVPDGQAAIANMPVVDQRTEGARRRTHFAPTPPLPTYLVAFAVGPLEERATVVPPNAARDKPLPLRGIAWRGRGADLAFALAEQPAIVAEQERYFDIAFPYPQLSLVAVPDFQSGAMENAGAIFFRDSALLVDGKVTTFGQRVNVLGILAHETAHQWFGDLVTMPWWDDLWLNEGFATFLATRTLRAVHPELEAELEEVDATSRVMNADSLASARRIRQPIESTHDITNAFDGITYDKGAATLAMLEHHVGADAFRRGVHGFLAAHALGNATTDDLVAALGSASGKDLAPIAASFLDRPGVPVISARATCEGGAGRVVLEQARWQPIGVALPGGEPWTVPVCVRAGIAGRIEERCTVLGARSGAIDLPACADWVMPNAGAAGYYRFTLPAADLARLRDKGMPQLATAERLAVAYNVEAAFRSGALGGGELVQALDGLARDPHGAVAAAPLDVFKFLDAYVVDGPARAALRKHVAALYAPVARTVGWKPAAGEPASRRIFRARLLGFLALVVEDPGTLAEAARLGKRYLDGDRAAVDPDLAGTALAAVARRGDAATFDAILAQLAAADDAQVRQRMLGALASVRAPALVGRALDLALDPRLHANERLSTIAPLLGAVDTRDAAWAWLTAHLDQLVPLLPDRYAGFMPGMYAACDPARADAVSQLFAPRVDKLTGGPRNLALALESAGQCAARVAAHRDAVATYARGLR